MIPERFSILRPYLASLVFSNLPRPPLNEIIAWFTQERCEGRAMRYIKEKRIVGGFIELELKGFRDVFYCPSTVNWLELCAFINEVLNESHWHNYTSGPTSILPSDVVVDCGAAEGLFSFLAAPIAHKVFAIEPMPVWQDGLARMFDNKANVSVIQAGVSHRRKELCMIDLGGRSKVASEGGISIQAMTIDELFYDKDIRVSFLKADIEGLEFEMLLGAEKTIKMCRPKIAMAAYHIENYVPQIVSFLRLLHRDYRFVTKGIAPNGNPVLLQVY